MNPDSNKEMMNLYSYGLYGWENHRGYSSDVLRLGKRVDVKARIAKKELARRKRKIQQANKKRARKAKGKS